MAEVGVHLDDLLGAALEGDAEAVEVGAAQALLGGPMPDLDARVGGRQLVGRSARCRPATRRRR